MYCNREKEQKSRPTFLSHSYTLLSTPSLSNASFLEPRRRPAQQACDWFIFKMYVRRLMKGNEFMNNAFFPRCPYSNGFHRLAWGPDGTGVTLVTPVCPRFFVF